MPQKLLLFLMSLNTEEAHEVLDWAHEYDASMRIIDVVAPIVEKDQSSQSPKAN